MRVLLIEPSGAGGIAHYTYSLVRALASLGVACEVFTSSRWNLPAIPGVSVHRLFRGLRTSPFSLLKHSLRLRREIDLVHWQSTTHPHLLLAVMYLLPLRNRPWIFTVHNVLPHEQTSSSVSLYRRIYRRVDALIYHTLFSQRQFETIFPDLRTPGTVIPQGEYGFLGGSAPVPRVPAAGKTVLFFGNIRPYKGLDILIDAFADVKSAVPEARLIVAGQALEPFQRYQDLLDRHGLRDLVDLRLGYLPDASIPALFAQADIVALPYRAIDQSAVLLLAMALGKTVVATDVGGISEVIRPDETGILTPAGDSQAFAEGLIRALRDNAWALSLGEAARHDMRTRFSWDAIAEQTRTFYQNVAAHE